MNSISSAAQGGGSLDATRDQEEVLTPGQNEKHYLAGALHLPTGKILHCLGPRKNNGLFRDLLTLLDKTYPARWTGTSMLVVDIIVFIKPKRWSMVGESPRFTLLFLPTICPRANPLSGVRRRARQVYAESQAQTLTRSARRCRTALRGERAVAVPAVAGILRTEVTAAVDTSLQRQPSRLRMSVRISCGPI